MRNRFDLRPSGALVALILCLAGTTAIAAPQVPSRFKAYASEPIGHERRCVVGVSTDDDGMHQKPVVYVVDAKSKRISWVARLKFPTKMYESRATHCNRRGDALFVLQQTDTQSMQSLSQTLLSVVKLNVATGGVQLQRPVRVPDTYSSWVAGSADDFRWRDDRLVIVGKQRPNADRENIVDFTVRLKSDLKP